VDYTTVIQGSPQLLANATPRRRLCVCRVIINRPSLLAVNHSGISGPKVVNFDIPDARVGRAHANEIDATEIGAYGLSLAAIEAVVGLVAIRRAETLTGADWYIAPAGRNLGKFLSGLGHQVMFAETALRTRFQRHAL
jgi:hypothetical protein